MKRWRIIAVISAATGERHYECEAETMEQALQIYEDGMLECKYEYIEPDRFEEPEIEEIV